MNRIARRPGIGASFKLPDDNIAAHAIFGGFLISIFFLNGAAATAVAILSFALAWFLILRDARSAALPPYKVDPIVLVFLAAITLRLLLPPYGDPDAISGAAASRALLLAGLYGVTLLVYTRLPFSHILWLIAGTAFTCAVIALLIYAYQPPLGSRLTFLGRASHSILGASAVGTGLIAAVVLFAYPASRSLITSIVLALMISVLGVGIYLSGSRGPMLALTCALVATPIVMWSGSRLLLLACSFGAWAFVTSTVLFEAPLKQALCPTVQLACRDSLRHDVWMASINMVAQHPLWGAGYGFRFDGVPHAHNAYLGIALHYGVMILILFCCLVFRAAWDTPAIADRQEKCFVVAMLIFANGIMGSDLSDPMRFLNTHYLFLWLPVFVGTLASKIEISRKLAD